MTIKFSPINDGQYETEINLNLLMEECHRCGFEKQISEICQYEKEYAFVSQLKNSILKYKSETLLPDSTLEKRKKLLFVFGNPANHSVLHNMFFFSNQNGSKHKMWSKLDKANILKNIYSTKSIPIDARNEEARERKSQILNGNKPNEFVIGLTTFYSFPTSADDGVKKVEELFAPVLGELQQTEVSRILGYSFAQNAKLVFLQQSSYNAFLNFASEKKQESILWPIRGKGSSGVDLKSRLKELF